MKRLLFLAVALLAALGARSQNPVEYYTDCAIITGEYEAEYAPDKFLIGIYIREADSKGKVSIADQQRDMMSALKEAGIDVQTALKTKTIASSHYKKNQNLAYGQYELELKSAQEVFEAYAALHALGISKVSLALFDRTDKKQLQLDAAVEALKNARFKAETIAAAEGRKVGKCLYFADEIAIYPMYNGFDSYREYVDITREDGIMDIDSFPEIGTVKIQASVQARFLLE